MRTLLIAVLTVLSASAQQSYPRINYMQGETSTADFTSAGKLETGVGRIEILLRPDVFLRLGEHSSARLEGTVVTLESGSAVVDSTRDDASVAVVVKLPGSVTTTLSPGDFHFDAEPARVHVYRGEAETVATADAAKADVANAPQTDRDFLLDIWSTNRRISLYSVPGAIISSPPSSHPYRVGAPFFGPSSGYVPGVQPTEGPHPVGIFHQVIGR